MLIKEVYQQGDVIISKYAEKIKGKKLKHLVLAEGEATGHSHKIVSGDATLFLYNQQMFLKVYSESAKLIHEEHGKIEIPQGDYVITKVLEYDHFLEESREVID
jgi:hypothetical protein